MATRSRRVTVEAEKTELGRCWQGKGVLFNQNFGFEQKLKISTYIKSSFC